MFKDFDETKRYIEKHQINFIDLKYIDVPGRLHHVTLPTDYFSEDTLKNGVGFDGSSASFFKTVECGDMCLIPDLSTGFRDPFQSDPEEGIQVLSFICGVCEADTKKPYPLDPRSMTKKAADYLEKTLKAESFWLPELEFYLFSEVQSIDPTTEGDEPFRFKTIEKYLLKQKAYEAAPPEDRATMVRNLACKYMKEYASIPIKYHHHEVGSRGQCEIELNYAPLLKTADNIILGKYFVRNLADQCNLLASFIPKPIYKEAGSGLHFHQYLKSGGKNIFNKPSGKAAHDTGYGTLTKDALSYISGLLFHADSMLAFTNPSTNSYKRLVPGFEAPVKKFFSSGNRSAIIRLPKYGLGTEKLSVEFRASDATSNPYLAIPAMLLSGIDGIKQKLVPADYNYGPIDKNVFELPEEETNLIGSLPTTMLQSLEALKNDHEYLLPVFTEDFLKLWIDMKLREYQDVMERIHPYEIYLYHNF
ncbi:MAG: glutamine synthetase beta-grasp domain-containing protein [Candidatus Wallbacteria bacterium]|nr:glutamine synthetase beta-grasp domain-containing protein [Candidatus Wallbacteria bacterium]